MFPVKKKLLALGVVATALSISTAVTPARAVGGVDLQVTKFALEKGVFNAIFAKELCSCQFVDGLTLDECKARDNLPGIAHSIVNITVDPQAKTVSSAYKGHDTIDGLTASLGLGQVLIGGSATAKMDDEHPEFGCVLTKLPSDP
jgi:hypothetical protein